MRIEFVALALLVAGCDSQSSSPSGLPPRPDAEAVEQLSKQTTRSLGRSFQPIFICGQSAGQQFQPTRSATEWTGARGVAAVVLAIDNEGALEVLKQGENGLAPMTSHGGLVVPVKFDPVAGDVAVSVAYTKTGVSETYAFSTFNGGPSFLTWTVNIPQSGERPGGRGVQAFIAQCVELPITPVPLSEP